MKKLKVQFLKDILTENEFNALKKDAKAFNRALSLYKDDFILSVSVLAVKDKRFLVLNKDLPKDISSLTEILTKIAKDNSLINPVHVSFDEMGVLIID